MYIANSDVNKKHLQDSHINRRDQPSSDEWYYVDRYGNSNGPSNVEELTTLYLRREVFDQTYVWNGLDVVEWTPLFHVSIIYTSIQAKIKEHSKSDANSSAHSDSSHPLLLQHDTHSLDNMRHKNVDKNKTGKSNEDTRSETRIVEPETIEDKQHRRRKSGANTFLSPDPKRGKNKSNNKARGNDSELPTSPATKPINLLRSNDPKQQDLERENMEYKAQLRSELSKIIEDLEIKFQEYEIRLDRCFTKQYLRVQKHQQVINVFQTQKQIHEMEEDEDNVKLDEKQSDGDNGDENETGDNTKSKDKLEAKAQVQEIDAKIAEEERVIASISVLKEYDKFQKKIESFKASITSL